MSDDVLDVYLEGRFAGQLQRGFDGGISFVYDEDYRRNPASTPLSMSMPKSGPVYSGEVPRYWIDNLLPDNEELRERTARKFGETRVTPFNLLRHVGVDAAGAVQIVPEGVRPSEVGGLISRSEFDIGKEIRRLHHDDSSTSMSLESGRWSLAGQQGKFALSKLDGRWYEPTGRAPSTHIFKVGLRGLRDSDVAEFVTMRAASKLGLNVAAVSIERFDGEIAVIARRYDRVVREGVIIRIHQEDSCQALRVPMVRKYQSDGGPSIGDVIQIVRSQMGPSAKKVIEELARWHAFNVVSGATDGHAKNISFLLRGNAVRLAPAYDLIAAPLISNPKTAQFKYKMAMKFGNEYRFRNIGVRQVIRQADEFGLDPDWYLAEVRSLVSSQGEAFDEALAEAESSIGLTQGTSRMCESFREWSRIVRGSFE